MVVLTSARMDTICALKSIITSSSSATRVSLWSLVLSNRALHTAVRRVGVVHATRDQVRSIIRNHHTRHFSNA